MTKEIIDLKETYKQENGLPVRLFCILTEGELADDPYVVFGIRQNDDTTWSSETWTIKGYIQESSPEHPFNLVKVSKAFAEDEDISISSNSSLHKQIGGDHYRSCQIQPIQYIEANSLFFLEGSVVERVTRHNKPTGKGVEDIKEAIHELELLLELRYGNNSNEN